MRQERNAGRRRLLGMPPPPEPQRHGGGTARHGKRLADRGVALDICARRLDAQAHRSGAAVSHDRRVGGGVGRVAPLPGLVRLEPRIPERLVAIGRRGPRRGGERRRQRGREAWGERARRRRGDGGRRDRIRVLRRRAGYGGRPRGGRAQGQGQPARCAVQGGLGGKGRCGRQGNLLDGEVIHLVTAILSPAANLEIYIPVYRHLNVHLRVQYGRE